MRKINKIIIHCSATKEGVDFSEKDINNWHKSRFKPSASGKYTGYHYVIKLDGTVQKGREEEEIGQHTSGHNADSIGIMYVGGLDKNSKSKDTRTPKQREVLKRLLIELKDAYRTATIHGHNEFSAKDCPCFNVQDEYLDVNMMY